MPEEMISIPKTEYDELIESQKWLQALENAGVNNWEGYDIAQEMMED